MKKLLVTIAIMFLLMIPVVYAQQMVNIPKGFGQARLTTDGNKLHVRTGVSGATFDFIFEGKLNGKPIEFKIISLASIIMNDGTLSDEEIMLAQNVIDIMKSALRRDKFEAAGISFKLKADGKTLQADIKSGNTVFEGRFEGTINEKPLEFKFDADGDIVVNNGELSDKEIVQMEECFTGIKFFLGNKNYFYLPDIFSFPKR